MFPFQISVSMEATSAARGSVEGFSDLWDAVLESVGGDRKKARYKVYSSLRKYANK